MEKTNESQLAAPTVEAFVRRLSDGKVLKKIAENGDEIRVIEEFPFWSPSGTVMKPLKLWHQRSRYEPA